MSISLELKSIREGNEYSLEFYTQSSRKERETILLVTQPIFLECWNASSKQNGFKTYSKGYDILSNKDGGISGEALIVTQEGSSYRVVDFWHQIGNDMWQIDRKVIVENEDPSLGIRSRLDFKTAFPEGAEYTDFHYFAPPTMYDHNDLDEDGKDDYLQAQNLLYREDRLGILDVMAYHGKRRVYLELIRKDQPEFDPQPYRPNKEKTFLQRTDIGSMGFWKVADNGLPQMLFRACYPFLEGERTYALLRNERVGWGAFWPAITGENIEVSYAIRVGEATNFNEALWEVYSRRMRELKCKPVDLPDIPEALVKYRLEAMDRYYLELSSSEDTNEPAGYVVNCHPQDGEQISDIIQYGFTGQNILLAYNFLRCGYKYNNQEYIRKARRVIDFFVRKAHIKETGMFYNLYNIDKKRMDFWWTGVLLPLAYAKPGESLEKYMGPIYNYWDSVIEQLLKVQGSYLRCMSEDANALLLAYEFEKSQKINHQDWLETAQRYGDFLVNVQESDGSWYRAYDINGKPIIEPRLWFGTTVYEQKGSSGTPIPFLVKLFNLTGEKRFIKAAVKAGKFVREKLVDPIKFCGGIHDSLYAKGVLIDNEGILFPMLGLLSLYKEVGGEYFKQGAIDAARLFASWTWLWDVPLPPESTLAKYNFRSTGIGGCDTCSAGYVHPFQLIAVPVLVEIAEMTKDETFLNVAELLFHGCNQTVAVPAKGWGYRYYGFQEEGYLISWWLADDPIFERGTSFGGRGKGEGNKTVYPWIAANAVYCYWGLLDKYGTLDFNKLKKKLNFCE